MPISAAALKAMLANGASPEAIIAALEAEEASDRQRAREQLQAAREKQEKRRELERVRQQRKRDRDQVPVRHATSRVMSRDSRDAPSPPSFSPTPPKSSPLTPRGGGGDAPADPLISEQAFKLAEQIFDILGVDREFTPPGWCGTAMFVQAGLNSGWRPELVLIAAQKVAASMRDRNQPHPRTFGYLTQPIIREHENHQRELPMVRVVASNEVPHAATQSHRGGAYGASKDRFRDAFNELKAANAERRRARDGVDGERGGGDGAPVELLRPPRRERS